MVTPIKEAQKGDLVAFTYRGAEVRGRVTYVKKDGTRTVELDVEADNGALLVDVATRTKAQERGRLAGERWAAGKLIREASSVSLLHMAQASGLAHLRELERGNCTVGEVLEYCQAFQNAAAAVLESRGQVRP